MKHKKRQHKKHAWQTVPMSWIATLIEGWERLKRLREEIKDQPEALAELANLWKSETDHQVFMRVLLDEIIPAARAHVAAWLADRQSVRPINPEAETDDEISIMLRILIIWECWLAIDALSDTDDQARWLSEISLDERRLISRLNKRITLSVS